MWVPVKEILCNMANSIGGIGYQTEIHEINFKRSDANG